MTYPYNEANIMNFDETLQMYVLDKQYVKTHLNIDLEKEGKKPSNAIVTNFPELWLKDVSQELYEYVYAHNNDIVLESIMKYVPSARAIIKQALSHWATYKARSGNLSERTGVLYDKGMIMDRNKLAIASVPPRAERVLNRFLPELGHSLLYAGRIIYNENDFKEE